MGRVSDYQVDSVATFEIEALPHLSYLKKVALYLVRNQAEAEDLVQETYIQALKSFGSYTPGTNCRAWLRKILHNKRLELLRSKSRYTVLDDWTSLNLIDPVGQHILPQTYIGDRISNALSGVKHPYGQIIWLSQVEGLTYREIAEHLEIPIGTVMSRLHRGLKLLRNSYIKPSPQRSPEIRK